MRGLDCPEKKKRGKKKRKKLKKKKKPIPWKKRACCLVRPPSPGSDSNFLLRIETSPERTPGVAQRVIETRSIFRRMEMDP